LINVTNVTNWISTKHLLHSQFTHKQGYSSVGFQPRQFHSVTVLH